MAWPKDCERMGCTDSTERLGLPVEQWGLHPLCAISAAGRPVRSVFRHLGLPQTGPEVLGADLNCSESRWARGPTLGQRSRVFPESGSPICALMSTRLTQ